MKDIKRMEVDMAMENFIINKEVFMMDNGKIIKCMAMVNCITVMGNQLMKDNGLKMNLMVQERYIMISQQCLMEVLIIPILIILNNNGFIMMDN